MEEKEKERRFTEEQFSEIKKVVSELTKDYHCEICKNPKWTIDPYMVNIPVTNRVVVELGGSVLPLLPITCTKCGNTHFLNLSVLKLLETIRLRRLKNE
ncbi:MAG: hypothetical protein NTY07_16530 [Bacteroidia bacterium]|nr:hypothetical protein [Bacteroidia bacterium]